MKYGKLNASFALTKPYEYTDEDGVAYKAPNFANLLAHIEHHRIHNGGDLALGWQNRVGDSICEEQNLPSCTKFASGPRKLSTSDIATFFRSMAKWAAAGFKTVDQSEAERRASICASCPKNVEIHGCGGCFKLAAKVKRVIGDAKTSYDSDLQGCEVCACSLQAKVWLPTKAMAGSRKKEDFPSHCWIPE